MASYIITGKNGVQVLVKYDSNGLQCHWQITGEYTADQWAFALKLPVKEADLVHLNKSSITKIIDDLSFGAFWNSYGNKVGKKPRAEKFWKLLTDEEKVLALAGIAKYNKYLSTRTIEKAYP